MLLGACAVAQTVEGTVINSVTGNGIPAMRVEIRPVAGKVGYSTTTDAQVHFLVEGVQAGTYAASSSSPDYSLSGGASIHSAETAASVRELHRSRQVAGSFEAYNFPTLIKRARIE